MSVCTESGIDYSTRTGGLMSICLEDLVKARRTSLKPSYGQLFERHGYRFGKID